MKGTKGSELHAELKALYEKYGEPAMKEAMMDAFYALASATSSTTAEMKVFDAAREMANAFAVAAKVGSMAEAHGVMVEMLHTEPG